MDGCDLNFTPSSEFLAMRSSTVFNNFRSFYGAGIIAFALFFIFIINKSSAHPYCVINTTILKDKDSIQIDQYLIKIIHNPIEGYGYDIYVANKLRIHQFAIPAVSGNRGFNTRQNAEKVARKVVERMQQGQSLPTISIEELKQWDVLPSE